MAREMGQPQYRFVVACLGENPGSAASVAFPSTGNPAQSADIAGDEALAEAAGADGAMAEPTLSSAPTLDAVDEKAGEKSEVKSNRPGTVVAYVKWSEFLDARSKSEWDVPLEVNRETVGPGIDLEIYDAFIGGLKNLRRRMIQGDPHLSKLHSILWNLYRLLVRGDCSDWLDATRRLEATRWRCGRRARPL
jgi:hypothetical protein